MEKNGNVLMQKYEFGRLLGQGNFAKVYHARDLRTGDNVAVKVMDKEKILKVGLVDQTKREISIMRLVKHPNVLQLYEVLATKTKIYFIIEYAKGGELFNEVAKGKLHEDIARKYFQQLISGVDFCHSRGVYHRDLKPENLLLDENEVLKVADFGLSALVESHSQGIMLHTVCGTPAYVAPEVISGNGYDGTKADVWSCGVILFVLLAGHLPFYDLNLIVLYKKISKAKYKFPNWFSFEVRRLLAKILDPNPETRISMAKFLENSWFRKGFNSKSDELKGEVTNVTSVDFDEALGASLASFNAFDIISLSAGLDLSGFFVSNDEQEDMKFTSMSSASSIVSTMEDVARILGMKILKKDGGLLKLERSREGRRELLSIDAEIFELTPSLHLVEMKKSCGDTLEYQRILKDDIRPALKDIVWVWQGERQ
ncbi:CBL-interacting protein kinase 2-like isoform X2 [Gastrolobium bilobum]|uniref:CBL-interacting protein kinase 2-like isoform X2 n=1 Tax=Gastrolobium bilobum TaxID=150636 RepID=UPI002AAFFCEC|nr:CBL-interacting protein kinase 2-like isoform X2 [Gastrolobium bilobum]